MPPFPTNVPRDEYGDPDAGALAAFTASLPPLGAAQDAAGLRAWAASLPPLGADLGDLGGLTPGAGLDVPVSAPPPPPARALDANGFPVGAAATSAALDPRGLRLGAVPSPPPPLPPPLPGAPDGAGQDGQPAQDEADRRQPVPPLVHGARDLLAGMVHPPPTAAEAFAADLAGGIRAGTAGIEGTGLPEPLKRAVRAGGPRAADVVEGLGSPNPGERGLALLGATAPPVAAAVHALGVPDRPLLPGVRPDTPVLGGLTNPTEVISGAVGPLEAAGALRYAGRGLGLQAARATGALRGVGRGLAPQAVGALRGVGDVGERLARETPGLAPAAGVVPVDVARTIPGDVRVPDDALFAEAVRNTPGAALTPGGLEVELWRFQKPEQAGAAADRVYYLPEPSDLYEGTRGFGGTQRIAGPTVFKRPLIVIGDTGGEVAFQAHDALLGAYATEDAATAVRNVARAVESQRAGVPEIAAVLERFGGTPESARAIFEGATADKNWDALLRRLQSNMFENIVAAQARRHGFDGIVAYTNFPADDTPNARWINRLSEVVDLREATYPTPEGGYSLRSEFRPPDAPREAPGIVSDAGRYYHGTGRAFDRPDPATFDPGGLYGPAYYLTDEPRVASSYADARALDRVLAEGGSPVGRTFQGAQVRPVDAPAGLRLLDVDSPAPIAPDVAALGDRLIEGMTPAQREAFLGRLANIRARKEPGAPLMGADLYDAAHVAADGDAAATNRILAAGGFDGIRYSGGQRIPLRDDQGRAIQHTALAIFPESLPKLRNALSGEPGGIVARLPAAARGDLLAGTATGTATGEANRREAAERGAGPLEQAGAFGAGFALGFPGGPAALRVARAARGAAGDASAGIAAGPGPAQQVALPGFAQPPAGATKDEWFRALRYNSMLTGPRTWEVNLLGGALELPWKLARDTAASVARGRPQELAPEVAGIWAGAKRGADAFMQTLATGVTPAQAAKGALPESIAARTANPVLRGVAHALEAPGRLLQATDEFFHATAYGMHLGREAARAASRRGLRGQAWEAEVRRLTGSPTAEMVRAAGAVADRATYRGEMGNIGEGIAFAAQKAGPLGHVLLPFLKTVYHITARGIDRSPLGAVGTAVDVARGAYRGGQVPKGAAPLGERLGDNAIGGLLGLWFIDQALKGNVTGPGPDNPQERAALRAQGWQPYALRLGDRHVGFANWGPLGVALAQAGAVGDAWHYRDEGQPNQLQQLAAKAFGNFAKLATEQSYLQSVGAIYRGLTEPEQAGEQAVTGFLNSLVPYGAALNTAGQAFDPLERRPERGDLGGALQKRFPVAREQLPEARTVFGDRQPNPFAGAAALSPVRVTSAPNPRTATLRRYAGSASAAQDVAIGRALDRYDRWRAKPREYPAPNGADMALVRRFRGRENPEYQRLVSREAARRRETTLARRGGGGGFTAPRRAAA